MDETQCLYRSLQDRFQYDSDIILKSRVLNLNLIQSYKIDFKIKFTFHLCIIN